MEIFVAALTLIALAIALSLVMVDKRGVARRFEPGAFDVGESDG